jgi:hypothetical protein
MSRPTMLTHLAIQVWQLDRCLVPWKFVKHHTHPTWDYAEQYCSMPSMILQSRKLPNCLERQLMLRRWIHSSNPTTRVSDISSIFASTLNGPKISLMCGMPVSLSLAPALLEWRRSVQSIVNSCSTSQYTCSSDAQMALSPTQIQGTVVPMILRIRNAILILTAMTDFTKVSITFA